MASAETLFSVPGGPYTVFFFLVEVLPGKFRECSRLVLPRLGYLAGLTNCVDDVLTVDRKQIFSR